MKVQDESPHHFAAFLPSLSGIQHVVVPQDTEPAPDVDNTPSINSSIAVDSPAQSHQYRTGAGPFDLDGFHQSPAGFMGTRTDSRNVSSEY